jgi:hypothetical protein
MTTKSALPTQIGSACAIDLAQIAIDLLPAPTSDLDTIVDSN